MPIRPEFRRYYRKHWHALSRHLREVRAGNTCECTGVCGGHTGPCGAVHGKPNPRTGGKTALTAAHLDQDPRDHDPDRLLVMCQSCHLRYDRQPGQAALRERIGLEILGQLTLWSAEKPRRQSFPLGKTWVRAVRSYTVHAAQHVDRAHPTFYAMASRRPMTITAISRITSDLPGWSRTTIRRCVKSTGTRAVGRDDRNHAVYDPYDVVAAVVGHASARWISGEYTRGAE